LRSTPRSARGRRSTRTWSRSFPRRTARPCAWRTTSRTRRSRPRTRR
jgi:hypothetical protein